MNPFIKSLDEGYEPDQILDYLSKSIPKFLSPISKAKKAGYTAKQIIGFLSKNFDLEDTRGMSESEIHAANARRDASVVKHGLKLGATALALPVAGAVTQNVLKRAIPAVLDNFVQTPQIGEASPPNEIPEQNTLLPSQTENSQNDTLLQTPVNENNVAESPEELQQIQEKEKATNKLWNATQGKKEKLDPTDKNFVKYAKKLFKSGDIKGYQQFNNFRKWWNATEGQPRGNPRVEFEKYRFQTRSFTEPQEESEEVESPRIEKNKIVATPKGIGEVKEIRNGKAIIDVDGKNHLVDEDSIESDIDYDEIADLYDQLLEKIPKRFRSSWINYVGYDVNDNSLLLKPHGGKTVIFEDIPKEFAEQFKNRLHKAKTSGSNMYGMWTEGDQSYGAGMSKLINELQDYYGKGNEYVKKYDTLFDILGIPHEAKKRKQKRK